MAVPGYTFRVSTTAEYAAGVITQAYIDEGFRLKSAPHTFPIALAHSSMATSSCIEVISSVVPVFLIPGVFRKMAALTVNVRVLDVSRAWTTLRVDTRASSFKHIAFSRFQQPFDKAVAALTAQGVTVDADELSDWALEKRKYREDR